MYPVLELCDGPECPRCGCQDSEILKPPPQAPEREILWWAWGHARCRHCGHPFTFQDADAPPPFFTPRRHSDL
jgi:hypothetical protein